MLYQKRIVKAPARGMTREAAVQSIQDAIGTKFPEGTEILDLKRRGDKWAATILEPHTAEFPPKSDDSDNSDGPPKAEKSESGDSESSDSKGPPDAEAGPKSPGGDKGPGGELMMMMDILTAIADKLGIVPGAAAPGAEDGPVPGEAPPPPPGPPAPSGGMGGPPGMGGGPPGHQEIVHKTKLKPGDTPPGVTPIGSPAFASTLPQLSRMASFDAFDDTPGKSIKQAKEELELLYGPHGFKVRQIKRVEGGTRLAAKLSRR